MRSGTGGAGKVTLQVRAVTLELHWSGLNTRVVLGDPDSGVGFRRRRGLRSSCRWDSGGLGGSRLNAASQHSDGTATGDSDQSKKPPSRYLTFELLLGGEDSIMKRTLNKVLMAAVICLITAVSQ